ncbi:uncharacterized protein EV422DRAFT_500409, partial [Fimicolochytrium jonesii]|uniref:uncharacterized protein n=1 Tax=Fimicolochytrium jonesii TaxID=1396493 RepID=UPI0022FDD5A2
IPESELRELVEIFSLVDVDHGGTISKDELATLMKTLGLRVSQVELDTMVNEIDVAGTGEIDFESFVMAMSRKVQTTMTGEEIRRAFRLFDKSTTGAITMDSLVKLLADYGSVDKRMSKEEAEDLVSQVLQPQEFAVLLAQCRRVGILMEATLRWQGRTPSANGHVRLHAVH